jgi:lysophospholipase L1-like esterase
MTQCIHPSDPRLGWPGAVSVQHTDEWVAPWRIPCQDQALFPPERLRERFQMPSGVRLAFYSDTTWVAGSLADPFLDSAPVDLCCDGTYAGSAPLADRDSFCFDGLPQGDKLIELWLPQFGWFRLRALELSDGATVRVYQDPRPKWINYGSSISQCRGAESPSQTWPAIVARTLGLNLTNLGVGGECHLDVMVARLIRDLPADLITLNFGINVQGGASLSLRTFRPAIIGFVVTVREKHRHIPIVVRSPIVSPPREDTPNAVGLTLKMMRHEVQAAVETLQAHGDGDLYYVDGLCVLGPEYVHLLPDGLHPNAEGYKVMGRNYAKAIGRIVGSRN